MSVGFGCCCGCDVCVTVLGCNSTPLGAGFTVTVKKAGTVIATGDTDSSGSFCFHLPSNGTYTFDVAPPAGSTDWVAPATLTVPITCPHPTVPVQMVLASGKECVSCLGYPVSDSLTLSGDAGGDMTTTDGGTWSRAYSVPDCGTTDDLGNPFTCSGGGTTTARFVLGCDAYSGRPVLTISWLDRFLILHNPDGSVSHAYCPVDDTAAAGGACTGGQCTTVSVSAIASTVSGSSPLMATFDFPGTWPLTCGPYPSFTVTET